MEWWLTDPAAPQAEPRQPDNLAATPDPRAWNAEQVQDHIAGMIRVLSGWPIGGGEAATLAQIAHQALVDVGLLLDDTRERAIRTQALRDAADHLEGLEVTPGNVALASPEWLRTRADTIEIG